MSNKFNNTIVGWAYQTAYLKAHYPVEYMSVLLKYRMNDKYEVRKLKRECERMGI